MTLDNILDALDRHHQRATYGAVAGLLGVPARSVMSGRARDWRHSWVVKAETGWPSGYSAHEVHPELEERGAVLAGVKELQEWMVEALCQGPPPLRGMDERVARALDLMRADGSERLGLSAVAAQVFLSPSRFAHLFTAEVGLPFRRYVLWRKLNRAMAAFGRGATLSAAAHAAGFADSAHLTRTWRAMFGITPSTMVGMAEFYEIPAPFEMARAAA